MTDQARKETYIKDEDGWLHTGDKNSCLRLQIIVPDKEVLVSWCKEKGVQGTWEQICRNRFLKELILNDITHLGKAGLKSFEQVKDIYVHSEMFSVDNGLLTPTLKTKRPDCKKCFIDIIESMYRLMG
ncbi:long-chain-fatty-acid--CoA ligase 6 [Caerostris extrusa]|uniref:Long-chain-fatty-acid--CoA ligase 6 n=1 Tax=Caerostris extrusa TaxID=172846 RepID=A0AAV4W703_CAEEX|nr:long-chain-fatty-acid--CoA ligase 6 [Caerostris extrusa]